MPTPTGAESQAMPHPAFSRLHPGLQRQLWRMQWTHLRPIQTEAIDALFDTEAPLLLAAATAAGKTEAAFLPILSQIAARPRDSVQALYVGPLRALITDQFGRLQNLCEHLDIPVHHWHGDVGATAKNRFVQTPRGVLLITPESLESLFVNRSVHLERIFKGLDFVIIDELHAFLGTDRGRQLASLLARLAPFCAAAPLCGAAPRRIGLSATLGKGLAAEAAARVFLSPRAPAAVCVLQEESTKPLRYRIYGYQEALTDPETSKADAPAVSARIAADIARHFSGITGLVFANARGEVEAYADSCVPLTRNDVRVHHGSLARDIRADAEEGLKQTGKSRGLTVFCSSTLELGIDLGDVEAIGQIGPPPTVASLKQRIGRGGRGEDQARALRMYIELEPTVPGGEVLDFLHLPLLQAIAATELMLDGWVEPAAEAALDFSTLTQQIVSVISQMGTIAVPALYELLCRNGAFPAITPALFADLLRCLGPAGSDVVEQTPAGELILGLVGEKLRHSRDFYAVFPTPREQSLFHEGRLLGQLPLAFAPPVGAGLVFAGRRWRVSSVEESRRAIHVVPAQGRDRPQFGGEGFETHPRLRQKMRDVLGGKIEYSYLNAAAARALTEARLAAAECGLTGRGTLGLETELEGDRCALLLWTGDRIDATARLLLNAVGVEIEPARPARGVAIVCRGTEQELREKARLAAELEIDDGELARAITDKRRRKYDWLLSDALLARALAADWLESQAARAALAAAGE